MVAPDAGLRFAGFRVPLPDGLDFSPVLPDGCGRDEIGLEVGLVLDVFDPGILSAGVLAAGVADSVSLGVERFRSPRVCPVR